MKKFFSGIKTAFRTKAFRAGGYSIAAAVIVIFIAVAINLVVGKLPAKYTSIDFTAQKLFDLSDQTNEVVSSLSEDITVYWLVSPGKEDVYVSQLLDIYSGMNSHIKVQKIDTVQYPNFAADYTTDSLYDNSLIVVSQQRSKVLNMTDIYVYDFTNYYTDGTYTTDFDGESALTSALGYVTSSDLPIVYSLTGHGESELSSDMLSSVTKQNISVEQLSLLSVGSVPDACRCLFIYSPDSDISVEEKQMILDYLKGGGNLFLLSDYVDSAGLPNLEAVMEYYGMSNVNGVVIEGDTNRCLYGYVYYLLPNIIGHDVTDPLVSGNYNVVLPIAHGIAVSEELRDTLSVSKILTTSDSAYAKTAGYGITTYDKEEGDIEGPFALGAIATETEGDTKTNVIWISSSALLEAEPLSYSSGANEDLFLNVFGWTCDIESGVSIHSKNIDSEYLTISGTQKTLIAAVLIVAIPLVVAGFGVATAIIRRRK